MPSCLKEYKWVKKFVVNKMRGFKIDNRYCIGEVIFKNVRTYSHASPRGIDIVGVELDIEFRGEIKEYWRSKYESRKDNTYYTPRRYHRIIRNGVTNRTIDYLNYISLYKDRVYIKKITWV